MHRDAWKGRNGDLCKDGFLCFKWIIHDSSKQKIDFEGKQNGIDFSVYESGIFSTDSVMSEFNRMNDSSRKNQ